MFPKHQFAMKLPRAVGLLGMAPAVNWVLAMSFVDTSFQRNPLAFDLYRRLGGWAAETRYATVQWHDHDFGLYYVGEKIERGPGRLELPRPAGASEDSGFLLTVDWPKPGKAYVESETTSTYFIFMERQVSAENRSFVGEVVNRADALAAGAGGHGQLAETLDLESFARYFIVEELARDVDGYAFSDFLDVHNGKLFHAAPWDFDLAFGFACMPLYFTNAYSGEYHLGTDGWNVENKRDSAAWIGPDGIPGSEVIQFGSNRRLFFMNLWRHPSLRRRFAEMWEAARNERLSDAALAELVNWRSDQIAAAARHDMELWAGDRCAFFVCCSRAAAGDFDAARKVLLDYLLDRARWIDEHVRDPPRPFADQPLPVAPAHGHLPTR